jgi:amino acid adenylation domain-containing protein
LRINAPKGTLTAALRAQIAERKTEILASLRNARASGGFVPPPISRRWNSDTSPLSFAQERLWFLEQLEPGSAVYNVCRAVRLHGPLKIAALEQSLREILRRHDILRTAFPAVNGQPLQVAAQALEVTIRQDELRHLSSTQREVEAERLLVEELQRPFDLSRGLLLRAMLLQLDDREHILLLTTHHIVSDAWSLGILFREFAILYDAYSGGKTSPLPELPVQYADYAVWQREWLQGEVLESQLSYWKQHLGIDLPVLRLPTDRPRLPFQSFRGKRRQIALPESLTTALNELSQREGVTLFMTLLAAFQSLLYRYTGQEDIVVGSPIANRTRTEVEELIGCFVNTLALRTDLSGKPTFRELLLRVRDVCFGAYAHQDLPFEKLVEELQPDRDLSRNPLFQVMFILQNAPRPLPNLSGISFARVDIDSKTSKFDLTLSLRERDGKLIGFLEYSTDLFDGSTIERMIGHLQTLLEGIVAAPDRPISTLPLLTEAERDQLLVEWNHTAAEYPKDCSVHDLFEAQVNRMPEAIAAQFEGKRLTYRELNSRANQLAHYLRGLGVGPEKLVGICVERSLEMVVGLLGILKAGGAYVPLDPGYPRERLRSILEDARVSVLLTQEWLAVRLIKYGKSMEDSDPPSSILDPQLVCLDRDWNEVAQQSQENPDSGATPENLAYVIYTSGSTGRPKGVQIEHRSVINLLCTAGSLFQFNETDAWTLFHSYAFDFSVWEIWVCLVHGGRLLIVPLELTRSPEAFHDLLLTEQVTVLNQTPSAIQQLIRVSPERSKMGKGSSLRLVIVGGEVLPRELASSLLEWDVAVWNFYGPTETTVWATIHQIKHIDLSNRSIPIGRPLPNIQIHILDTQLQPVPIGMQGELYIGGVGVARGYLSRPELTLDRFVPSPFHSGSRFYRTGDLARYQPDGNIEFLGRLDNQLKIRGHRVEPGEIEAVLNQHPGVREAVVVTRDDATQAVDSENPKSKIKNLKSDRRLVAYVVPHKEQPSLSELRKFLQSKLPEYMVPSIFVPLETLPLTPNRKVDLDRLPLPGSSRPQQSQALVEPRTDIEELVAQAWRQVLNLERVGVNDNFFEFGGHSLLATQVVSRLRDAFHREIPLRILFEAPTVASLAMRIEEHGGKDSDLKLPPILAVTRDRELPLSFAQEQLWSLDQMLPGTHFFNVPFIYRLSGVLNVEALEKSLQEVIRRHETLRTVFGEVEGRPVQIIKEINDFQLFITDLRSSIPRETQERAAALVLEERRQSFDLSVGPLWRAKLLQLTDTESFLLITMHHIICDQWSMRILRSDLSVLYEFFSHGEPPMLPELPIQFADFAWWERHSIDSEFMKAQLAYWKQQLADSTPTLEFGKQRRVKKRISFRTSRKAIEFDEKLFSGIKSLARKENCTPFMILIAALSVVLFINTGQTDIRIGTLAADRRRKETELTVGHFVNTVILRIRLSPSMSFGQLIRQAREVALAAYSHQELPFEQLARVFEQEYKIDRRSLFQVLFTYQNLTALPSELPGLTFAPLPTHQISTDPNIAITSLDLIFDLRETSTKLTGSLTYKTDHLNAGDVTDIMQSCSKILGCMISGSEKTLSNSAV